jgi:anaerobic magnesium-protoporphyrin IX monomethyl ester cyclase
MVLLTHGYFLEEDEKEKAIMKPYVPLGILYISAYLESKGITNEVFDSTFSNFQKFKTYLLDKKPPLIGIYTNLMTKLSVIKIIDFIKQESTLQDCKVILGGPEIRFNAENYLRAGADILVVGEGEQTFFELCSHFEKTSGLSRDTGGTAFLDEHGKLFYTADRELIKDLNILPMPARKKVDLTLYGKTWKDRHGYSMYSISSMRGCPYTCKWCSRAVYGGTYRRRNAKLVVDEMEYLQKNYAPDRLWFVDDVFTINHKWLREFRDELISRKLTIPYEIITRSDRMNEEVIAILKETGCFRVWIGAESGSQEIIDAMDRRVDVSQVREMIIKTKKAGMEAGTFIMLGYPGEKKAHIRETIEHLKISDPSSFTITVAYPITGTPLYNEVSTTLKSPGAWTAITDREYDFKRTRSTSYYRHAVRWVTNEVGYSKTDSFIRKIKHKSSSYVAQLLMMMNKGKSV